MIDELLERNRRWAEARVRTDPEFFSRLAKQQRPKLLWIGCSDARVTANNLLDLDPGEVFVHRNIANLANHSDLNYLSVLQFAVEFLEVEHIIVCGHYGCGGIRAAMSSRQLGLIDNWVRSIRDIRERYRSEIERAEDQEEREDRLCELNVVTQTHNVARTPIVQNAWGRGRRLVLHGFVYRVRDGILHDLGCRLSGPDEIGETHRLETG
jgi:carbonic anhydrase